MMSKKDMLEEIRVDMLELKLRHEIDERTYNRLRLSATGETNILLTKKIYVTQGMIDGYKETIKTIEEMIDEQEENGEATKI